MPTSPCTSFYSIYLSILVPSPLPLNASLSPFSNLRVLPRPVTYLFLPHCLLFSLSLLHPSFHFFQSTCLFSYLFPHSYLFFQFFSNLPVLTCRVTFTCFLPHCLFTFSPIYLSHVAPKPSSHLFPYPSRGPASWTRHERGGG